MKLFAVIGNPISHSRSPVIHNSAYIACNAKNHCYTRLLLENEKELKDSFCRFGLNGANITVPFKEEAYRICDHLDEYAKKIGSVNTIIKKDGKLFGKNTDAPGFAKAIEKFGNLKSAVIMGAGGTTRAVVVALKSLDIDFIVLNRSPERLTFFHKQGYKTSLYTDFSPYDFDILINTTSTGLIDKESLPCDRSIFEQIASHSKYGFDVVYGKSTPFQEYFKSTKKEYQDGSDMLLYQAFYAFESFLDVQFDAEVVLDSMKKSFAI